MDQNTLYIDYSGSAFPQLERIAASGILRRVFDRLSRDSSSRRNPRTLEYMTSLTARDGRLHRVASVDELDREAVAQASRIVMLWRDGNGCGWSPLETAIARDCRADARISVINGRRREFSWTPEMRRYFRRRRFLEKSLLGEAVIASAMLVATPWFVLSDAVRGRLR
jgi:hypothetical protein